MLTDKTDDRDAVLNDVTGGRCGTITRDSTPCRKWPVGGAGEGRCRFHGGASTGPDEPATDHLEDNDHAVGNDGGAPEGNANAEIHGGFSDWRKAYDRLDNDTKAYVDTLREDMRETAKEHAPHVPEKRRERLLKEKATLSVVERWAGYDAWEFDAEDARGFVIEER